MATQELMNLRAGEVQTVALTNLGDSVTETVAGNLSKAISKAIADTNLNIQSAEDYAALSNHRDNVLSILLKGPKVKTDDPETTGRAKLILQVESADGHAIAVAVAMPVCTRSVDEFYGPLASLCDGVHKAITGARKATTTKITDCLNKISPAQIKYKDECAERERKAAEERKRQQEQLQRTHDAEHWISQLAAHGQSREVSLSFLSINGQPVGEMNLQTVTDEAVADLRAQLEEVLEEEARQKEINDLTEAVRLSASYNMTEKAYDLAVDGGHREIAEKVLGKDVVAGIEAERKRKAEELEANRKRLEEDARVRNVTPPAIAAPPPRQPFIPARAPVIAAPPPPPRPMPAPAVITQTSAPKVEGEGERTTFKLVITNPLQIPAEMCRPPQKKMWDADSYPRLQDMASDQGKKLELIVPGIRVDEERKITGRRGK